MTLKTLAILMAGQPLRGSIENVPDGEVAVVQMKYVDPEVGIQKDRLYRVNLTCRKKTGLFAPRRHLVSRSRVSNFCCAG
jgi:hypothetical protein